MGLSKEMRLLDKRWRSGQGWPKRLQSLQINGLRGWTGQRVEFNFPIVAIVGENGVGKSTVLQCAASIYQSSVPMYPTDFFPETGWDEIKSASIGYEAQEGERRSAEELRKLARWRGYSNRPVREVKFIDLRRIQPLSARIGYTKLAKKLGLATHKEISSILFDEERLRRFSNLMGKTYESASLTLTDADRRRPVSVLGHRGRKFSAFHHGAGEATMQELLAVDFPAYSLVLIDEIEASLHARVQRRLISDLADVCRARDIQIIITTHSPMILEELPDEARICIMEPPFGGRRVIYGVSPELAMTKMDDIRHIECEIFVEDKRAATMLTEIVAASPQPEILQTCQITPCGPANVCVQLGDMVRRRVWGRPVAVFTDGDQPLSPGCYALPGGDSPERVVFNGLRSHGWEGVGARIGREHAEVVDQCERAMTNDDDHVWPTAAATGLSVGGDTLWQALCAVWAKHVLSPAEANKVCDGISSTLAGDIPPELPTPHVASGGLRESPSHGEELPSRRRRHQPSPPPPSTPPGQQSLFTMPAPGSTPATPLS
jgi:predicted ATPase